MDDEPALLELTKIYLERSGDFSVEMVDSAPKAIELLKENRYDAIVSDYQMPGMDGIKFLKKVRESGDTVPFIIFTGKGREEVVIEALNAGVDFYIQKGGEPKSQFTELAHKVRLAVQQRRTEKQNREREQFISEIMGGVQEGIIVYDGNLRIRFWNKFMENLTGMPADQVLGRVTTDVFPFLNETVIPSLLLQALNGVHSESPDFAFSVPSTGRKGWVSGFYSPHFNPRGEIVGVIGVVRDVTERKKMEEDLRTNEEKYRSIFDNTTDAIQIIKLDAQGFPGMFVDVNQATCDLLKCPRDEMLRMSLCDIETVYSKRSISEIETDLMSSASPLFETTLITKTGCRVPVEVSLHPITLQGSKVCISVVRNIADRKSSDNAIRESEERYRILFDTAHDAIFLHEINSDSTLGRYLMANDVACRWLGYSREELLNMTPRDIISPVSLPHAPERARQILSEGYARFEGKYRGKDGTEYDVDLSTTLLRIAGKTVVVTIARDITEKKQVEEALRESEEKYRSIIENMGDVFYRTDNEGVIIMISNSGYAYTGLSSPDQLVGKRISDYWENPEEREKFLETLRRDGSVHGYPVTIRSYDGNLHTVIVSSHFYRDKTGTILGIEGIIHDITDLRRAENGILLANKKLNLLSSITRHDINNQLLALRSYLQLSRESLDDRSKIAEFLSREEKIVEIIDHQITFTKDYEDLGVASPTWQKIESCVDKAKTAHLMAGISIENDISGIEIYADPLLRKVFSNLVDNALRHGGPSLTSIGVSAQDSDDGLRVIFADDGKGIPASEKEKIFEKGFGKNTGMGLFLAREILGITGITIRETGIPGEGARFEIFVPKGTYRFTRDRSPKS